MDTKLTKPEILKIPAFEDFRGYLAVPYDQSLNFTVRQINQGYSKKAFTLRGLHFQEGEHAQAKLVSCLHGSRMNIPVRQHRKSGRRETVCPGLRKLLMRVYSRNVLSKP